MTEEELKKRQLESKKAKKDKDCRDATIFAATFLGFFEYFMYNENLIGLAVTIGVSVLILYMDYRTEKVKKRYEKLKYAYYSQVFKPTVDSINKDSKEAESSSDTYEVTYEI